MPGLVISICQHEELENRRAVHVYDFQFLCSVIDKETLVTRSESQLGMQWHVFMEAV
jgi:hypothetical protein